jgi:GT2 family glycosyltransferase
MSLTARVPRPPKIVVSILNWNDAQATLACLHTLRQMQAVTPAQVDIVVMDNGSAQADWQMLRDGVDAPSVRLLRQEQNLGFSGGHNIVIRQALADGADFVWLLNNDALVAPDTLIRLLAHLDSDARCGAISPMIVGLHDVNDTDFCGAMHDWRALTSIRPETAEESAQLHARHPDDMWLHGTAVLYRAQALTETGLLDEGMFAYFEDDDFGARLSRKGWRCKVAFDARIQHEQSTWEQRPPYYFYLMTRNGIRFWLRHTPKPYRRLLRARLLSRALLSSANLRQGGYADKSRACLLGAWDGLRDVSGPPRTGVAPPLWLTLASYMAPYHVQRLVDRASRH